MGRPTQEAARFPATGTLQHAPPGPNPCSAERRYPSARCRECRNVDVLIDRGNQPGIVHAHHHARGEVHGVTRWCGGHDSMLLDYNAITDDPAHVLVVVIAQHRASPLEHRACEREAAACTVLAQCGVWSHHRLDEVEVVRDESCKEPLGDLIEFLFVHQLTLPARRIRLSRYLRTRPDVRTDLPICSVVLPARSIVDAPLGPFSSECPRSPGRWDA